MRQHATSCRLLSLVHSGIPARPLLQEKKLSLASLQSMEKACAAGSLEGRGPRVYHIW